MSGRVVVPGAVVPGHVEITGDRVTGVRPDARVPDDVVAPGFVDLHCHGGGGHTFTRGDPADAAAAAAFHLRHGTTTLLASLVSDDPRRLRAATAAYRPLVAGGVLAGVHWEGPWLSPARRGAHDPALLRHPAPGERAAPGVRMVTVAPELPGALELVAALAGAGVVVAVGHTDASYEQTRAAVAAGARVATHLWNGMRPPHHRDPGPVAALLDAPQVVCELIADGVHLHPGALAFSARAAAGGAALVTDATAAAGAPDGTYDLGGLPVTVTGGTARTAEGALAGSTLTMDAALRAAVAAGVALPDACAMAATVPARVLGLSDRGALAAGRRADLVVLSADLRVSRVMRGGRWA